MIDCNHLGESSAAYALGALTPDEKRAADRHLAECAACRREVEECRQIVGVLPLAVPQATPHARLKRRILASARGDRSDAVRISSRGRSAWPAAGWLVAAAALVIAGVSGSNALRERADMRAQTAALQSRIAAQRRAANDAHAVMVAVADGAYWTFPTAGHGGMHCSILQPPNAETAMLLGGGARRDVGPASLRPPHGVRGHL